MLKFYSSVSQYYNKDKCIFDITIVNNIIIFVYFRRMTHEYQSSIRSSDEYRH